MIEIKVIGTTPSELKNMLIEFLKKNESLTNLVFDDEGDLTHEVKEWESDGYGYNSWKYDEYSKKGWYNLNGAIIGEDTLSIGLIGQKHRMLKNIYAFYHTELPCIILKYFDNYVESIKITSQPIKDIDELHENTKYQG